MSEKVIPVLKELLGESFRIGAAVNPMTLRTTDELIAKHFNSLTAENHMKFEEVHPQPEQYTFEKADIIADYAKANGMKMRGHTLVWHNQTTKWVFEDENGDTVSREVLLERLQRHIQTVMHRYKGLMYAWDVVNEAIEDHEEEQMRDTKWLQIIGDDYIHQAFTLAHEADPDALLFYNDYNETDPVKRQKIYNLVKSLLDRGTPIHGIGMQAHWNIHGPSLEEIRDAIELYASLGLQIHITELDISMFAHDDRRTDLKEPTAEMLELQKERFLAIFKLFEEYKHVITSVTLWGAADDYTWLHDFPVRGRRNWPMLFDEQHQPKASFWKLADHFAKSSD